MSTTLLNQIVAGTAPELRPLTVDEYHAMLSAGILVEGEPIELIDGILVRKDRRDRGGNIMGQGNLHSMVAVEWHDWLNQRAKVLSCHARCQMPITIRPDHEPEPDVAIVDGRNQEYGDRLPVPSDIHVVVEIADSSLNFDRTTKQRVYAQAGIPHYLLVNLVDSIVEFYGEPDVKTGAYRSRNDLAVGDVLRIVLPAGPIEIELTTDLLPART